MHLELTRPGFTDGVITCMIVEAIRMKGDGGVGKMGRERAED